MFANANVVTSPRRIARKARATTVAVAGIIVATVVAVDVAEVIAAVIIETIMTMRIGVRIATTNATITAVLNKVRVTNVRMMEKAATSAAVVAVVGGGIATEIAKINLETASKGHVKATTTQAIKHVAKASRIVAAHVMIVTTIGVIDAMIGMIANAMTDAKIAEKTEAMTDAEIIVTSPHSSPSLR